MGTVQRISNRALLAALAVAGLAALAARFLPGDNAWGAALRLGGAAFLIAFLPGLSLVLAWKPSSRLTAIEALALGAAANLGLVQLLTIAAIGLHLPANVILMVLAFGTLALLVSLAWRGRSGHLAVWPHQVGFLVLLLVPAAAAYVLGTPFTYATGEDGTHVSVVRRLALLQAPAIDNIYWAPGVVYTYPFPATHYLIALISRVADLDPLFVYRKIRFLWALEAQLFLFAAAKMVFRSERLALLTGVAGALFSLAGPFALVQNFRGQVFSWSQLIPQSHAADVAMNVCLPALLVVALWLLSARRTADRLVLGAVAAALVLLLTIVHVREAVQFYVYIGALVGGAALLGRWWLVRGGLGIFACGMAVTLGYLTWYQRTVGHIDTFVRERRDLLVHVASEFSPAAWISRSFLHPAFGDSLDSFFFSWFPVLLLLLPPLLMWRPRRPQVILVFSSVLAYLLIVRFPLLTVPYIYLSYFEILFTPVRNVVFFAYLMTGFGAAIVARLVWGLGPSRWRQGLAIIVVALLGALVYRRGGPLLAQWPDRWIELVLLAHVAALYLVARRPEVARRVAAWMRPMTTRAGVPLAIVLIALVAALTFSPKSSPLVPTPNSRTNTVSTALEFETLTQQNVWFPYNPDDPERRGRHKTLRVPQVVSAPPAQALVAWASRNLPLDAVLAINLLNLYSPAPFMPQQIAYWPHIDSSTGSYFRRIFPAYYRHLEASLAANGEQPFFNTRDGLVERMDFLRDVGATHVLIDPMYHDRLVRLLATWPRSFELLYDAEGWAVYKAR
jgi:hypothetical protein